MKNVAEMLYFRHNLPPYPAILDLITLRETGS